MTNEVIHAIKQRRSVRKFEDKKIENETLKEIIQAGRYAPSAKNDQPWKFIVITKKEAIQDLSNMIKKELRKILKLRFIKKISIKELREKETLMFLAAVAFSKEDTIFFNAPALVLVLTKDKLFYDESCACCAQNMMLAAYSLGIGSCWIGFASVLGLNKKLLQKIGVPKGYHISAALIFGYPMETSMKLPPRKIGSDIIKWIE